MTAPRAGLLTSLPDFGLAAVFLITWIRPTTFAPQMVKWLMVVMMVEFVIIHSAAFMGVVAFSNKSRAARAAGIVGLGLFYSLFAGAFSFVFKSWWPLTAFWGQTLNRMLGVILGQGQDIGQKAVVMAGWGAATVFYLLSCIATIILPVPRLGITPQVVAAQHIPGGGLWVDRPEKVIAFGFLYFTLTAWSELSTHRWAPRVKAAAALVTIPRAD